MPPALGTDVRQGLFLCVFDTELTLKWTGPDSPFLSFSKDLLKKCYSAKATYLFQQDKFYDVSYDTGDKSIQCSRRPDAFKFWMTWKALGTLGLEERVNRALALSRYVQANVRVCMHAYMFACVSVSVRK